MRVIVHEYIHVQQFPALNDDEHPTLLERSLIEGGAEFGTELIVGQPAEVTSPRSGQRLWDMKGKLRAPL